MSANKQELRPQSWIAEAHRACPQRMTTAAKNLWGEKGVMSLRLRSALQSILEIAYEGPSLTNDHWAFLHSYFQQLKADQKANREHIIALERGSAGKATKGQRDERPYYEHRMAA